MDTGLHFRGFCVRIKLCFLSKVVSSCGGTETGRFDCIHPAPPFAYSDMFGPPLTKEGRKEQNGYGALFTCMASPAVHIEAVKDLSTDSFINALRRFTFLHGSIRQLRLDRGTSFTGAERELRAPAGEMDHGRVRECLLGKECDYVVFKTNVPTASHMGGVWERQIRSVRSALSSLLASSGTCLDDDSLRTLLYEAAAIVNSPPLTVHNLNDPLSVEPLTANHLLTMRSAVVLPPPGHFQRSDGYCRKRWRRVQCLVNQFWHR